MNTNVIKLQNRKASVDVFTEGASLHNYCYRSEGGETFKPFAEAVWQEEHLTTIKENTPRHLQLIGGEWPCVPFGTTENDHAHHGYGSDHEWRVEQKTTDTLSLSIDYPLSHNIKRLTRGIKLCPNTGDLELSLEIVSRTDCRMPVGLHPIFKLPQENNTLHIVPPKFKSGSSAPSDILPKTSKVKPSTMITLNSELWDTAYSLGETLIQIWQTNGKIELQYLKDKFTVHMTWNEDDFPHCLFWIASPGLNKNPLGGGFTGIGVEPTHSFFDKNDLADQYSSLHKINDNNFGVELWGNVTWRTDYRIGCQKF